MPASRPMLLVIDYNLSRIDDVRRMREYARDHHGAGVILVRGDPTVADREISDEVIDLDPLREDFVAAGEKLLAGRRAELAAGIVFSDNAVHSGAALLHRLGLAVDAPEPAFGAFCKHEYRLSEARHADLLDAQRVFVPDFAPVGSLDELRVFAGRHPEGFVVKPTREGNNRGVVRVRPGDDLQDAYAEVLPYLAGGVIGEELIPYRREYSFDGVGSLSFLTEKVSAAGRYPVEVAQVLPARVSDAERATLQRTGLLANWLVGQRDGPFHNEIKISDDGTRAAVVEPNRRPAGMKIWSLAHWVYGVDLYHRWIDAAFGRSAWPALRDTGTSAATVMLGVPSDRLFAPRDLAPHADPFADAVAATTEQHGLRPHELVVKEFSWLSPERRRLHRTPRDNADFAAQGCVLLTTPRADLRDVVRTLRTSWLHAIDHSDRSLEFSI